MVDHGRPKLEVTEFRRIIRPGEDARRHRVELLEGRIVSYPEASDSHLQFRERLARRLELSVGSQAHVRLEVPVRISAYSQFFFDVCLIRKGKACSEAEEAAPEDILLAVEIASPRQPVLRRVKVPACVEAGLGDLWLVDLPARQIELMHERRRLNSGDLVTSLLVPSLRIPVAELFDGLLPN